MNSASPGVIALFQPDHHYGDHAAYLRAVGAAMRAEYQAIAAAGLTIQIDSPDLALGRHMMFADADDDAFLRMADLHVDVLNEALGGIPPAQVRVHVCWGNYAGPHHRDIPLARILPVLLRLNAGVLSFEASNPRHAHEWTVFRDTKLPDDKALMPGCLDSTTNFIEHPELVAERIVKFAEQVGKERVLAGTDCGFSTFAGYGAVDEDIVYAKLRALAEGAAIATRRLWGRAAPDM
jgi:5-methyltetrahydropteroyltriglutamate--homocysteine methyltransferase